MRMPTHRTVILKLCTFVLVKVTEGEWIERETGDRKGKGGRGKRD